MSHTIIYASVAAMGQLKKNVQQPTVQDSRKKVNHERRKTISEAELEVLVSKVDANIDTDSLK